MGHLVRIILSPPVVPKAVRNAVLIAAHKDRYVPELFTVVYLTGVSRRVLLGSPVTKHANDRRPQPEPFIPERTCPEECLG